MPVLQCRAGFIYYNNAWKDQLTSYDNKAITYDASGNPTSYLGATLTWSRGRLLTKYVNGSTTVDIQYDARGFKKSSTKVMGTITSDREYIYNDDGRLLYDRVNTFDRYYLYGQDGIVGFEEDGVVYAFRKNLFGDVTAIYQGTTKLAEYVYDAWGNCKILVDTNGFGTRNAIRYRGYYWDSDLNMYYLLTRYYDPQTGRFINADTPEYLKPSKINGLNLYSYCNNNPVMNVDPSGYEPLSGSVAIWLLSGCFALIFTAMYFVAKNTPPSEPKDPLEGTSITFDHDWFVPDIKHPFEAGEDKTLGIGLALSVWKGLMYLDSEKKHSLFTSIGNAGVYAGIDLEDGIGIEAKANVAEVGYDGRVVDASLCGLSVGFTLMYHNGTVEFEYGALLWGWSASVDLIELGNVLFGGKY